jgi:hypothetical protein
MMLVLSLMLTSALMSCDRSSAPPAFPTRTSGSPVAQNLEPAIELAPASGYAGTYVAVRGSGWRPSAMVVIKLADAQGQSSVLTAVTTDANGQFSSGFLYPIGERWLGPGNHQVVASIDGETVNAVAQFTVAPPAGVVAPSPASTITGTMVATATVSATMTPGTGAPTLTVTPAGISTPVFTSTATSVYMPHISVAPPSAAGRRVDLLWVPADPITRIRVGLSASDGAFRVLSTQEFAGLDRQGYELVTGDFNGDDVTDLLWNQKNEQGNRFAISQANGDGTFASPRMQEHRGRIWQNFKTLVGDINGDGRDDLVWNETIEEHNRIYAGLSNGDGTFLLPDYQDHRVPRWQGFKTLIGDVNGDGRDDLIWNETIEEHNRIYVGLSNGDGSFVLLDYQEHRGRLWQGFQTLIGDVNGDGLADLIWNETRDEQNRTYIGVSIGDGAFELLPYQDGAEPGWQGYQTLAGEVNGDGRTDLLWNYLDGDVNSFAAAISLGDGTFDFRPLQEHFIPDWTFFQTYVGDVNGDGLDDLIWNRTGNDQNQVAVGLSNGDGSFQLLPDQEIEPTHWGTTQTLLIHAD